MKRQFNLLTVFVALLLLVLLPRAFAQDVPDVTVEEGQVTFVTPVATEPTPPVTPTIPVSSDPLFTLSLWQILAGFATAFSLGGLTIGTGLGLLASRLRHNPATMAAIEGLAASTPDTALERYSNLMDKFQYSLSEAFALVREAIDKRPAAEKTPEEREAVLYPKSSPDVPRVMNRES